jgi:hypothetical protein
MEKQYKNFSFGNKVRTGLIWLRKGFGARLF